MLTSFSLGKVNNFFKPALIRYVKPETSDEQRGWWGAESIAKLEMIMAQALNFSDDGLNQSINPSVKKQEMHSFQSDVTEQTMEDGSIISEHVIQKPISISLSFEETNSSIEQSAAVQMVGGQQKVFGTMSVFDKLVEVWEKKIICQIVTEHKIYNNMVIANLPIQHIAPYRHAINVTVEFVQLNFSRPVKTIYMGKSIGTTMSSMATQSAGMLKLT